MAIYITPFIDFVRSIFRPSKLRLKVKKEHPDNNKHIPQHPSSGPSNRQGHPATTPPIDKGNTGDGSTWHDMERVALFAKEYSRGTSLDLHHGLTQTLSREKQMQRKPGRLRVKLPLLKATGNRHLTLSQNLNSESEANAGKAEQADERKAATSQSDGKSEK